MFINKYGKNELFSVNMSLIKFTLHRNQYLFDIYIAVILWRYLSFIYKCH